MAGIIVLLLVILPCQFACSDSPLRYIQNDAIKLGINLESGGAIGYFSLRAKDRNLLNRYDRGRFIQQSYYGDQDGSVWRDKPWCWNPVQGGDWQGNSAKILASSFQADQLTIVTQPRHWASGKLLTDTVMRMHVTLEGPVAHIKYSFHYKGHQAHARRAQELPAVFVDYALPNLVFYRGDRPWQNALLTRLVPNWPNEYHSINEPWAAYVDEHDWGLGIYSERMSKLTCYRYRGDQKTGSMAAATSYLAPIEQLAIGPGFHLSYQASITIGKLNVIRARFYDLHQQN
ncbi:MAG: hypothetical protein P8N76_16620 [Pirellulaceae bacterium]|nr:hypothetical protein [Pirellulaceae bacterium]